MKLATAFQSGRGARSVGTFVCNPFVYLKICITMLRIVCSLLLITIMVGCKKHTHKPGQKTMEELLTSGKWTLVAYGYDDNHNSTIDTDENLIIDCQKDNTIEYKRDGSGVSLENQSVCMADPVATFQWKFIGTEKRSRYRRSGWTSTRFPTPNCIS